VATPICVNYKPPFNYELHEVTQNVPFNSPFVNLKNNDSDEQYVNSSRCVQDMYVVTRTLREGVRVGMTAALSLCTITEFQNTQAYCTLHPMATTPYSGKSYTTTTCCVLEQNFFVASTYWLLRPWVQACVEKGTFVHLVGRLTKGPKPLPKRALHIVRSRASSFTCEYPLLSLSSSSSFLRLLPRLPVTSIPRFIL
jgi:hypothetical protein